MGPDMRMCFVGNDVGVYRVAVEVCNSNAVLPDLNNVVDVVAGT